MDHSIIDYFISLVKIDSESKSELAVATKIMTDLKQLGAEVIFDSANKQTGGDCGNLIAYFKGTADVEPVLLCAHLDTVVPGNGIKPIIKDGVIRSDGTTILGADDKSGIAEILYGIKGAMDSGKPYPPIEILFTISEEIGLCGSRFCDYSLLKAKRCFTFDTSKVGSIMNGSPSQNSLYFHFKGKKAHAGVEPEKGINAIRMASEAIANMPLGRIDEETTCNIGIINGGEATNIVPDSVLVEGEVRSHSMQKLEKLTEEMCSVVRGVKEKYNAIDPVATVEIKAENSYPSFYIEESDELVQIAVATTKKVGLPVDIYRGGGGSDANILIQNGIKSLVIGTGMANVHTVDEYIKVADLEVGAEWVKELLIALGEK
ncbi:MAG: M20/M25/M40 family metallo-hydrolase [Candidatus Cloacimonas sp.]|jgi:tripeptide aminopeptidase|nr:M20/M25/M40 family metallo-hydrolase [Candidatus Cloacimonadota bacterium]